MLKANSHYNNFLSKYLVKFLLIFSVLYFGTKALIGITSPGGFYSTLATDYLDYISLLRNGLLYSSKALLSILGYHTYLKDTFTLKLDDGRGVKIVYSCIGYGLMSFWMAFIIANKGKFIKKMKWMLAGLFFIFFVNVMRISLMLIGIKQHWSAPFGLDNHTLFNITVYSIIFIMIYLFDLSEKKELSAFKNTNSGNQ